MIPFNYIPANNQIQLVQPNPELELAQEQSQSRHRMYYTNSENPQGQTVEPDELRRFVKRVYLYACICIVIACLTWSATIVTKFDLERTTSIPKYAWLILTFILLVTLTCIPELRYLPPWNLIIMLCVVLLIIIEGMCLLFEIDMKQLMFGVLATLLLLLAIYSCEALCSQENMADLYLMLLILMSFLVVIILMTCVIAILASTHSFVTQSFFLLFFVFFVLISILIGAKYIHGQFEILSLHDIIFNSLTVFIQFSFLLFLLEHIFTLIRRKYARHQ